MSVSLSQEAQDVIRASVEEAGGTEVLFGARLDSGGSVCEIEVLARGDTEEVPAVLRESDSWDLVLHNHPDGDLRPSKADLAVACRIASCGKGFAIVDNEARSLYVVVEPNPPRKRVEIPRELIDSFFSPQGPLAQAVPGFEARKGQLSMARAVAEALNERKILAVEAGTGSGKSFAYLVPGILYAVRNRTRLVVATGTINLQEQLMGKDLPLLKEAFQKHKEAESGFTFSYASMKGRANYLCKRRACELAEEPQQLEFSQESRSERAQLEAVLTWAQRTGDGTLSDLPFTPVQEVWDEVASDPDQCTGVRCSFFKDCFYWRARLRANQATVLVVNHHLFFADVHARLHSGNFTSTCVLPPWDSVVFDEAHDLEEAASSFFGISLSSAGVVRRLGRLYSAGKQKRGLLVRFCERSAGAGQAALGAEAEASVVPLLEEARRRCEVLFQIVASELTLRTEGDRRTLRCRAGEEKPWPRIFAAVRTAADALEAAGRTLGKLQAKLQEACEEDDSLLPLQAHLNGIAARVGRLGEDMRCFAEGSGEHCVRWAERKKGKARETVLLRMAPLWVGPLLRDGLWTGGRSFILTSATLSVAGRIDYLAERLGLEGLPPGDISFVTVQSPFAWDRQAMVLVPTDIPEVTEENFPAELARWIAEAVRITRGRAFVLFTSYQALRSAFNATCKTFVAEGLQVLRQGQMPRTKLLETFRRSGRAVLFGTESFWQGVDVRGDALSLVIIARLPFAVPTEPLQCARTEEIERRGGDPFRQLSLPQAVLKLRQGAGRLIRSRQDRGAVLILDRRILSKWYGRVFLSSLPPLPLCRGSFETLIGAIRVFFAGENSEGADPREGEQ